MASGTLNIDLDAIVANWRALDALSAPRCAPAAVVKADAYGLGVDAVARRSRVPAPAHSSSPWPKRGRRCAARWAPMPKSASFPATWPATRHASAISIA